MDIIELVTAVQSLNAEDAFHPRLNLDQWRTFAQYLSPHEIRAGDLLIRQGDSDRTVYLLGRGTLQVYVTGGGTGSRVAVLRPGSITGEPALFVDGPRGANVEAMTPCTVWALRLPRFEEMAQRVPALALEISRAAGAVLARRLRASNAAKPGTPLTPNV